VELATRIAGAILMSAGVLVVMYGIVGFLSVGLDGSSWTTQSAFITMGSGTGVLLCGLFFCALGEIIGRLPEPKGR
jgi:hypothetical protein